VTQERWEFDLLPSAPDIPEVLQQAPWELHLLLREGQDVGQQVELGPVCRFQSREVEGQGSWA